MNKKKFLAAAASTAMLSGLVFAGSALAADRVEVKVTSEPIQSGATCDKAGGFSLEFDSGTTLTDGDQITIDTAYVSPTNFTALCRDIDIVIAPGASARIGDRLWGGAAAGAGWTSATIPADGTDSPVTATSMNAGLDVVDGVVFHVAGASGSQRITMDVVGIDTAGVASATGSITVSTTVAGGVDELLRVRFLDQDVTFATPGIYTDDSSPQDLIYETAADLEDNTLCINVSDWTDATVNANMDSAADKFTFIPSNPQIAHIVAAHGYAAVACTKATCGDLVLGSDEQNAEYCGWINNEAPNPVAAPDLDAYCSTGNVHANNELVIERTDGAFENTTYNVRMEILVNGEAGDNGVYFANSAPRADGFDTLSAACAEDDGGSAIGATTFYRANGAAAVPAAVDTDCSISDTQRTVSLNTAAHNLNLNGTSNDYLYLNIPVMHYDLAEVESGDDVSVRVTLTKAPCGELLRTTHCIGSFVNQCATAAAGNTITYPYFTDADDIDGFWDGIAVTNTSNSAGDVTFTMYETDGDVATATVNVAANSMYVNTLSSMVSGGDFTLVSGSGPLGDARSYIVANGDDIAIDGFAMIANGSTGESMGYLPRQ